MEFSPSSPIDLHIHSTASDGSLSPSKILSLAQQLNLGAISITDHDTVAGSKEALKIGIPSSTKFITGVEISAAPPSFMPATGSLHILGYRIDLEYKELIQCLEGLQTARAHRNPLIVKRLNALGFAFSLQDVEAQAGDGQLGRPHLAEFMKKKGYVASIDEAFDRYLGHGKPAYVDKYRVPCDEAIDIIRKAGGIPVLAHPYLLDLASRRHLENILVELKKMGLMGLEVYYPQHPPDETDYYAHLTEKLDLLKTGGTDFHGDINPEIRMGSGYGDFFVPFSIYTSLMSHQHGCSVDTTQTDDAMNSASLDAFMQELRHHFTDRTLLKEALRHSSFVNEHPDAHLCNNERLEFLGDAVLNLVVGHILMERYPDINEGELSRMRASLVNETQLAKIARNLHLGKHIQLGRGETQSQGWNKNSILADTFEAVVAAVYLDGGLESAGNIVHCHFADLMEAVTAPDANRDYKSQLQEHVQLTHKNVPRYQVVDEIGPDHDKTFRVRLSVGDFTTNGVGKSKKLAEQDAARKALRHVTADS